MCKRIPYSIGKAVSGFLRLNLRSQFIHTTTAQSFLSYSEQVLASKLAQLLQSCTNSSPDQPVSSTVAKGKQIHTQITVNGINNLGLLGTRVLGVYVLCGRFTDAKKLFSHLNLCYASPWNWMIRGLTAIGSFKFALMFFFKMLAFGTFPDKYTFPYVIKACRGVKSLKLGRLVHGMIKDMNFERDVFVCSALIKLYADNGGIKDAQYLFERMTQRDGVLWNVMLNAYAKDGKFVDDVGALFREMKMSDTKPDSVTFCCVLSVCGSLQMTGFGTQIHGQVIRNGLETDSPVMNTLIAMYTKCRSLFDARVLFDSVNQADFVTWNAMVGGYVQNGFMSDALELFRKMIAAGARPDSTTFTSLLPSFYELHSADPVKEIHGYIIRNSVIMDVFLKNELIDMYFKFRCVGLACRVFDYSPAVDVVVCSAMISGFVLNGMVIDALEIFKWMLHEKLAPNAVTLASVLPACAGLVALKLGRELHGSILRNGFEDRCYVGSALSDMYAKCGRLDLARLAFSRISEKDAVSWNSIITSYCQNAKPQEAIELFRQMGLEGAKYDCVSISSALCACANLSALQSGRAIHGFMIRGEFCSDLFADSALIDMYAKSGRLELARRVFDMMEYRNEVSWNSIIAAYGNHGHLKDSLALFSEMREGGFKPDHVTFLAMISSCGHAGHLEEGRHYFDLMTEEFGISAQMEHYACLIDLYGRAGRLAEAYQVVQTMPFPADAGIWGSILGACRVHGNVELAELASNHLFQLDPQNSGYYVLLSHVQADAGIWQGVDRVRNLMKERGVQKIPGYSWIEVNQKTHTFVATDTSHPQASEIYLLLKLLLSELRKEGDVQSRYADSLAADVVEF